MDVTTNIEKPPKLPEERIPWWLWITAGMAVLVLVGLACRPYIMGSGGRDARRAEGEQLMGSARDAYRVGYSKSDNADDASAFLSKRAKEGWLTGKYYSIDPTAVVLPDGRIRVNAVPLMDELSTGYITFELESGRSEIHWD